ncbi:hypothetical protein BGW36DRAFT_24337 [Talaromyces proteolyticus]|uniref:Uncharacterized protein n=1 Tax=Talaromyces proteolyticus TaxID=1131652 RepID=A0AAD4KPH5_9EURO|nr:uncharacterized protein BGW36DRAFT_24337 [Talaromyces proteolyticus]KAH8692664.1 hypothetical protein BGW36DRAFT_24337 [Talaromyces proteolyticus]
MAAIFSIWTLFVLKPIIDSSPILIILIRRLVLAIPAMAATLRHWFPVPYYISPKNIQNIITSFFAAIIRVDWFRARSCDSLARDNQTPPPKNSLT